MAATQKSTNSRGLTGIPTKKELLNRSRESALSAIQIFNSPTMKFKSESYVVLMIIAWTYLMQAYFKQNKIDYRYSKRVKLRQRFELTKEGDFKYWELAHCLKYIKSPLDIGTRNNLEFLITLRNRIEHQSIGNLDDALGGRYQACALNYNFYLKKFFGHEQGIDEYMQYSLQLTDFNANNFNPNPKKIFSAKISKFVESFEKNLSKEELEDSRYAVRLIFTQKLANKPGQADRVVEFIDPMSKEAKGINPEHWVAKEVEKVKFLSGDICREIQGLGYPKFNQHQHTELWKLFDAKDPRQGYGVQIAKTWYWYETWLSFVKIYCAQNGHKYKN
jgi:hypothetical protein